MKIRPLGEQLFHAHGQTNRRTVRTKLIVAFRNLANTPKQGKSHQRMKKIITKIKLEEERTMDRTEGIQYRLSVNRS